MKNMQSKMMKTIVMEVKCYFVTNGGLLTLKWTKPQFQKNLNFTL